MSNTNQDLQVSLDQDAAMRGDWNIVLHALEGARKQLEGHGVVGGCEAAIAVARRRVAFEGDAVKQITSQLNSVILALQCIIVDPASLRISQLVDFEVRPANDQYKISIGREGWGWTDVSYTSGGVDVSVMDEDHPLDAVASTFVLAARLCSDVGGSASSAQAPQAWPLSDADRNTNQELLVKLAQRLIDDLRATAQVPVSIDFRNGLHLSFLPSKDDDRVMVHFDGLGSTSVNYTDEGVIVDVFNERGDESIRSLAIHSSDLESGDEPERSKSQAIG